MKCKAYTKQEFHIAEKQASDFANAIRANLDQLIGVLLEYESHEVALDEISRTLDLLDNLKENEEYFSVRVGDVTTFLPRNQPLYALTCFVLIPSLQASAVHYRTPQPLRSLLPKVSTLLDVHAHFPNVLVSQEERLTFLKERSAVRVNELGESYPLTDVVIFTGTPKHADQLRLVFDQKTLFITNGAGHNPIVISETADLQKAVDAVLTLTLYNQGQDCAAPNAILVHANRYQECLDMLRTALAHVKIGQYNDITSRVGPISNPDDLPRIQTILTNHHSWLDPHTPGIINTRESIVEPTIIAKPLSSGGNYTESFAPILFVQKYETDEELSDYFDTEHYRRHAMYLTVYGESAYIQSLVSTSTDYKDVLHTHETFLHNTHLHEPGIERGTKPYGGYGIGASNVSINGTLIAKPTLPQRDIYEYVAKPLLAQNVLDTHREYVQSLNTIVERKVEKILKLHTRGEDSEPLRHQTFGTDHMYLDSANRDTRKRFTPISEDSIFCLLDKPNVEYIAVMNQPDLDNVRVLHNLLTVDKPDTLEEFTRTLYDIPKHKGATNEQNTQQQLLFFKHVYWLLFNKGTGPRLAPFLWEVEAKHVDNLLNV